MQAFLVSLVSTTFGYSMKHPVNLLLPHILDHNRLLARHIQDANKSLHTKCRSISCTVLYLEALHFGDVLFWTEHICQPISIINKLTNLMLSYRLTLSQGTW